MTCKMCNKDSGKNKTCSPECLAKLKSINGTRLHKEGKSRSWNDRVR